MRRHALDSSLNKLYVDTLTLQISSAELLLASLLFVLSLYGEILRGRNCLRALIYDHIANAIG